MAYRVNYTYREKREKTALVEFRMSSKDSPNDDLDLMLDPNHSHFILVDDGSNGYFDREIDFRSNFEAELRKGRNIRFYQEREKNIRPKTMQLNGVSKYILLLMRFFKPVFRQLEHT